MSEDCPNWALIVHGGAKKIGVISPQIWIISEARSTLTSGPR